MLRKISIIITIILLTGMFFHYLYLISEANKCTGVRSYACKTKKTSKIQKLNTNTIVKNNSLNIKDFIYYTNIAEYINGTYLYKLTDIKESEKSVRYIYGNGKLIIDFDKNNKQITFLKINGKTLSKEEIDKLLKSNYR